MKVFIVAKVAGSSRASDTGGPEGHGGTTYFAAKRKSKGKKERVSKQKLLKGCHLGQNVTVLAILKRLEFKHFSCQRP